MNKVCIKCGVDKPLSEYHNRASSKDGKTNICKNCRNKMNRKYHHDNKGKCNDRKAEWRGNNSHKEWARHTIRDHKKKGIVVDLSTRELAIIAQHTKKCSYCNVELNWLYGSKIGRPFDNNPTLDRTHNEKYIYEHNIQIICHKCNSTKRNRTHTQFVEYCGMIANKFS